MSVPATPTTVALQTQATSPLVWVEEADQLKGVEGVERVDRVENPDGIDGAMWVPVGTEYARVESGLVA
jgi:hypothetical protein